MSTVLAPCGLVPYYEYGGISIYCGDCREILPLLPKVDAVITDPPYGETALGWDARVPDWTKYAAMVASSMWVFGSLRMFMEMAANVELGDWKRSQEVIWEKHNGSGFHADKFRRVHELVVHFYRNEWSAIWKEPQVTHNAQKRTVRSKTKPAHFNPADNRCTYSSVDGGPLLMRSVIRVHSCHGYAEHPTQKPLGIIEPLIRYSVPPQGILADPFMGSGSTLVAAKNLGRQAIGIDISEENCATAVRRLRQDVFDFGGAL